MTVNALNDEIVLCSRTGLFSATVSSFSDSNSDSFTAVFGSVISASGAGAMQCYKASATSTTSVTGSIGWSGGTSFQTLIMDVGCNCPNVDAIFDNPYTSNVSCLNVNGTSNCPPGSGDLILTTIHATETLVAVALVGSNSGAWCSTASNCAINNVGTLGVEISLAGSAKTNTTNGSGFGGTNNLTSTGSYGASLQYTTAHVGIIAAFTLYSSSSPTCVPTLGTLGVSACG